jgi:hypothetical protein
LGWLAGELKPPELKAAYGNERANSALARMAKFFLALIAIAFTALLGIFVFVAFTF